MRFFGSFEYSLDNKGRVCLPSKMRCDETKILYIIRGFDGCISLYTEEGFDEFVLKLEARVFEAKADARKIMRNFLASVEKVETDGSGRILIPKKYLEKLQITSKVAIVGVNDHIEIWELNAWKEYVEGTDSNLEETIESLFENEW